MKNGQPPDQFKSGYVTIAGRPNTGKSTLLNRILGQKVAIISPKPNTTRNRITGIKTMPGAQIVFLDTPGIHLAKKELNKRMVEKAVQAAFEADLLYLMVQADGPWVEEDFYTFSALEKTGKPMILVINRIDLVEKQTVLPVIDQSQKLFPFKEIVPISALRGDGIEELLKATLPYLPEGEPLFPQDMVTDQAERSWAAELVREKVINLTREEIPYSCAVVVTEWQESAKLIRIRAVIYVERDSQKGIIIGRGGAMVKKIGQAAREEIEQILGAKIFLELRVKVSKDWTKKPEMIKRLLGVRS